MTQIVLDKDTSLDEVQIILQQQLPLLTQPLKTTLDKLTDPTKKTSKGAAISTCGEQIKINYNQRNINFNDNTDSNFDIPIDTYQSIMENLLENARSKRILDPNIEINVKRACHNNQARLTVCDTGKAMPEHLASILFTMPLDSEDGFGIGLYQSQQQARHHNMELELYENIDGRVCFRLEQQEIN